MGPEDVFLQWGLAWSVLCFPKDKESRAGGWSYFHRARFGDILGMFRV